jgi:hypothetical protein
LDEGCRISVQTKLEMIDDFGDEVPFDELDPCCQKEVLQQRRNKDVKARLRVGDRSNVRFDLQQSVFTSRSACVCCADSKDYPLLTRIRNERAAVCGECTSPPDDSEDSDDELFEDDFVSPQEQERKAAFLEHQRNIECAKQYGLACHLEDSLDHIAAVVTLGVDLVLHVFYTDDVLCAKTDVYLEDLAVKYIGTKFRRVRYAPGIGSDARLTTLGVKGGDVSGGATLLCFRSKLLCAASAIDSFAEGSKLYTEDVFKFLDGCRVLTAEVPLEKLLLGGRALAAAGEDEDETAVESFCDDPDCTKRYAHEHVGRGGSSGGAPASFLLDSREQGMDALEVGALQRL